MRPFFTTMLLKGWLLAAMLVLLPAPVAALPAVPPLSEDEREELLRGGPVVTVESLKEGVSGVVGRIMIRAGAEAVWEVITDYDHHWQFIPSVLESGLVSDDGVRQEMFQTGRTGYLLFRKRVHIRLLLEGERPRRLRFRQKEGDFKVYRGEWRISDALEGRGVLLMFLAEVKPDFFAPSPFVRKVQKKDLPRVLEAMKRRAEHLQPPVFRAE
jgi:ribosome-associated toxin RatA of RatAB toxin-antitoxin module